MDLKKSIFNKINCIITENNQTMMIFTLKMSLEVTCDVRECFRMILEYEILTDALECEKMPKKWPKSMYLGFFRFLQ